MSIRGPIGLHVSPETKIKFFEQRDARGLHKVQAKVSKIHGLVEVVLPETQSTCVLGFSPVAARVESLLRNRHLKPVYVKEKNQVEFKPFFTKSWERAKEISVPPTINDCQWICRSNGTISYAFINTVKTWDPINDTWTVASYLTTQITALSEDVDGVLVVGDAKGQLHLSGQIYPTGITGEILEIIPMIQHHFLIKFSNRQAIIFDGESKKGLEENKFEGEVFVVGDRSVVFLKNNTIVSLNYDLQGKKYGEVKCDFQNVHTIRLLSTTTLLIFHKDKKSLTLWNFEKKQHNSFQEQFGLWNRALSEVILLDDKTFVTRGYNKNSLLVHFIGGESIPTAEQGTYGISAMVLLSNGSVMCATKTSESMIYFVQKDATVYRSISTDNNTIQSFKELVDGSVAVKFSNAICILKPCFKELENINHQIGPPPFFYDSSKLKSRNEPADPYEKENQLYKLYLSGLEAAVKCNNLYQARRFYEKARKIKPYKGEPMRNFLFYLNRSPYEKLKRQCLFDLYTLTQDERYISLPKDRKYKKRLLIGEGGFSFTEALLFKHKNSHPELGQSITATELLEPVNDQRGTNRIVSLQKQGVTILFGVDAQKIHHLFKGRRFERIQWNCPFGDNALPETKNNFSDVLPAFFRSCSRLQLVGDRIHVTLVQESNGKWISRQRENPIVEASASSNYRLIRKRRFGTDRYPQYHHVKTGTVESFIGGEEKREFVFEKVANDNETLKSVYVNGPMALKDPAKKEYKIEPDEKELSLKDYYFVCSSDEDSSDYYESD